MTTQNNVQAAVRSPLEVTKYFDGVMSFFITPEMFEALLHDQRLNPQMKKFLTYMILPKEVCLKYNFEGGLDLILGEKPKK